MKLLGQKKRTVDAFKAVAIAAPIILKVLDTILAALQAIANAAAFAIDMLNKINPLKAVKA
jgi:hypothetical protein